MVERVKATSSPVDGRSVPTTVQRAVGLARQAARDTAARLPRSEPRESLSGADMRDIRPTALLLDGREARAVRRQARRLGLPRTFDDTAAWAAFGALAGLLRIADDGHRTAVVVDRAGPKSTFSRWARAAGFAPAELDVADADITSRSIDDGSVDMVVHLHPGSPSPDTVDVDLALSADALRKGGLVTVTLRLGPPDEGGLSVADLRSLIARMAEQGLGLVGDLDLDDTRRAHATHAAEGGSFGLALLTFRRR